MKRNAFPGRPCGFGPDCRLLRGKGLGISDLTLEELREFSDVFEEDVYENVSLEACVSKRTLPGGPARESVLAHIHSLEKFLSGLDAE